MKGRRLLLGVWVCAIAAVSTTYGEGLSTPFADVEMQAVALGQSYVVRDAEGHGLRVKNLGASPIRVVIDVLTPQRAQLRPGAEPIPDVHWVEVHPVVLELGAHEEKESVITLRVPRNKTFRRRYFQVMIWSRGSPSQAQGMSISAGLLSKLRFHTKG